MPTGAKTLLVVLLLPFLAALGHDVYLSYFSSDEKIRAVKALRIDTGEFQTSDLGWIWSNYSPNTMETSRMSVEPEIWKEKVDPILQISTIFAALAPFVVGVGYLILAFILGVWPFGRYGQIRREKAEDFAVYKHAKSNAIKYKKK